MRFVLGVDGLLIHDRLSHDAVTLHNQHTSRCLHYEPLNIAIRTFRILDMYCGFFEVSFLPHEPMRKRGTGRRLMSVRLSVCLSHSYMEMAKDLIKLFLGSDSSSFWLLEPIWC